MHGISAAWGGDKYAGCYQMTFRNVRDIFNQMCRTTEEISSSMQWFDLVSEALATARVGQNDIGIAQTLVDVSPRIAIYSSTNDLIHSIQVAGKYEYDIGLTGLVTHALGLFPNVSPFLTKSTDNHPDPEYIQQPPDLVIAVATMR